MTNKRRIVYLVIISFIWISALVVIFNPNLILSNTNLANGLIDIASEYDSLNCISITTAEEEKTFNSLKEAIDSIETSENVILKLNKDIRISEAVTIPSGINITIDGGSEYSILYGLVSGNFYTGKFFDIKAGGTLNLNNVILNGENEWLFNSELYNNSLITYSSVDDVFSLISSASEAPIMRTNLINNSGTLNVNNSIFKNFFSNNGCYIFNGGKNSTININGSKIVNNASSGTVVSYISGVDTYLNVNGDTLIDGNFAGANGGIFKTYSGAVITLNSGTISNNKAVNTNGVVSMTYGNGTKFIMNGGSINNNSGIPGLNNGRNAPIYIHSGSRFIMNGGVIENNKGTSCGGVDAPGHSTSNLELNSGVIRSNHVKEDYTTRSDLNVQNDYDLIIGSGMVIDGNAQIQGDVTNNGVINGTLTLKLESKGEDLITLNGTGTVNGDFVVYHAENAVVEVPTGKVNGYIVNCDISSEVVVRFNYNGGVDLNNKTYKLVDLSKVDITSSIPNVFKVGYTFTGWYYDKELTNKLDLEKYNNESMLYAGWEINYHNAVWIIDGKQNVVSYKYGDVIAEYPAPSKANYNFGGWTNFTAGMTLPDYDVVFEATWSPVLYNVTFNFTDGNLLNNVPVYYGNTVATPVSPVLQCKKIVGWYYDDLFTNLFDFNNKIVGNTTLYAKWEDDHIWNNWVWYDKDKHVRDCKTNSNHLNFENHTIDESGYCSVCRNYGYLVKQIEEDKTNEDSVAEDKKEHLLTFVTNGLENKFVEVKIDKEKIDSRHYIINEKNEIILSEAYVQYMKVGEHTLTVVYEDGESSCEFLVDSSMVIEVKNNNIFIYLLILLIILIIVGLIIYYKNKDKKRNKKIARKN